MQTNNFLKSRIPSLYSDFRALKDLNPHGYEANVAEWRNYLLHDFDQGSLTIECGPKLLGKLEVENYGAPKSIDPVLDQLVADGLLISLEEFNRGSSNAHVIKSMLRWTISKTLMDLSFKSRANNSSKYLKEVTFVIKPRLEDKYCLIQQNLQSLVFEKAAGLTDLIFSKQEFYKIGKFNEALKSWSEYEIMLTYLESYQNIIVTKEDVVKVIDPRVKDIITPFEPESITENDEAVASVKSSISRINVQIKDLNSKISHYTSLLNESLKSGSQREVQKKYLKTKKILESNLSHCLDNLQNLLHVKSQIDKSADNLHLYESISLSTEAMKSINKQIGGIDEVEMAISKFEDQSNDVNEMNDRLLEISGYDYNEEEIDEELARMEKEQEKQSTEEENVLHKLANLEVEDHPLTTQNKSTETRTAVELES